MNRFWVAPAVLLVLGWIGFLGYMDKDNSFSFKLFEGIGRNEMRLRSDSPMGSLDVGFLGDVEVTDDETGFRSLSPDGRVEIEHRDGFHKRRLSVEPAADGTLVYTYTDNGREAPFDAVAMEWLAGLLPRILSETAIGAPARVTRLLARGGPEAVLAAIAGVENGSAVVAYCEELLAQARPEGETLERVVDRCDRGIPSSGDKARFLMDHASRFLEDDRASSRFFDAVDGIASSGDHAEVLLALVEEERLAPDRMARLLASAREVASSNDRTRVLIAAAERPLDRAAQDEWFAAAETVPSSSDRTDALLAFLDRPDPDREALLQMIDAAEDIPSSGDQARVFLRVADFVSGDRELEDAYLAATGSIASNGDRDRARSAVLSAEHTR